MAFKIHFLRVKKTAYLAGYFGLMLYTLSGLMFQSSMLLFVGALSWFVIVSSYLASYITRYRSNRLRAVPKEWDGFNSAADGELKESWWVGIVGRFFVRARCTYRNHLKNSNIVPKQWGSLRRAVNKELK
jgi:hypothetical protein